MDSPTGRKQMKYFVTGATGFVGGRVVRQLLEAGHEVVILARNPVKASGQFGPSVRIYQGDITEKESLRKPMEGVDGVFHIAGWYKIGVRDKSQGQRINVEGTRNVLETMQELGIPKGVYTSSVVVYSNTHGQLVDETYRFDGHTFLNEYERTKWVAHYQVAEPMIEAGLPLVIVQPGPVYGPGDTNIAHSVLAQYLQRKLPLLPTVTAFSFVHVDDVSRGHILAMEKGRPGERYNLTGDAYTLVDTMRLAAQITGLPAPRLKAPPAVFKQLSLIITVVEKLLPLPDEYTAEYLRTIAGVTSLGDYSKASSARAYQPPTFEPALAYTFHAGMDVLGMKAPALAGSPFGPTNA